MAIDEREWRRVWGAVRGLVEIFPDDVVLIGGVAVFLHARAAADADLPAEFTHDADLYVSLASWADIRDLYEVTSNRRLSKHQLIIDDVEFDLYLQRNNGLRLDYDTVAAAAVTVEDTRVAALHHLLLLKLDAARARWTSAHGGKDRRDIAKLLVLMEGTDPDLVGIDATSEDLSTLDRVLASEAFRELAEGNAHLARRLRGRAERFLDTLKARP